MVGARGFEPPTPAPKAGALPDCATPRRNNKLVPGAGLEPARPRSRHPLKMVCLPIPPPWRQHAQPVRLRRQRDGAPGLDSNRRPAPYRGAALPTELQGQTLGAPTRIRTADFGFGDRRVASYAIGTAKLGGGDRNRTDDILLAKQALSQLSYTPENKFAKEPRSSPTKSGRDAPTKNPVNLAVDRAWESLLEPFSGVPSRARRAWWNPCGWKRRRCTHVRAPFCGDCAGCLHCGGIALGHDRVPNQRVSILRR